MRVSLPSTWGARVLSLLLLFADSLVQAVLDIFTLTENPSSGPAEAEGKTGRAGLSLYLEKVWNMSYTGLDDVARRKPGPSLSFPSELEARVSDAKTILSEASCMGQSPWNHIKMRLSQQSVLSYFLQSGHITSTSFADFEFNSTVIWDELVKWRTRQAVRGLGKRYGLSTDDAVEIAKNVSSYPDLWDQSPISKEHIEMFLKEDLTLLPEFNRLVQKLGKAASLPEQKAEELTNEITAALHDPSTIAQGGMGFCGPAALLHVLAITQPDNFVSMAESMFCSMTFELGGKKVGKRSRTLLERLRLSKPIEAVPIEESQVEMRALDWMMTSTLRSYGGSFVDQYTSAFAHPGVRLSHLQQWAAEAFPKSTQVSLRLFDLQKRSTQHKEFSNSTWAEQVVAMATKDTGFVMLAAEIGNAEHMQKWLKTRMPFFLSFRLDSTLMTNGHAMVLVAAKEGDCYLYTWGMYTHMPCDKLRRATDFALSIDVANASSVSDLGKKRLKSLKENLTREGTTAMSQIDLVDDWWGYS